MRGWAVSGNTGGPGRLVSIERDQPVPGPFEVLVSVEACGICRTDLHLADGDLPPRAGCESQGTKSSATWSRWARKRRGSEWETGSGSPGSAARAGCAVRVAEEERTCADPRTFTGWDADGGYAQYAVVHEGYAYALPAHRRLRASPRCSARGSSATAL